MSAESVSVRVTARFEPRRYAKLPTGERRKVEEEGVRSRALLVALYAARVETIQRVYGERAASRYGVSIFKETT